MRLLLMRGATEVGEGREGAPPAVVGVRGRSPWRMATTMLTSPWRSWGLAQLRVRGDRFWSGSLGARAELCTGVAVSTTTVYRRSIRVYGAPFRSQRRARHAPLAFLQCPTSVPAMPHLAFLQCPPTRPVYTQEMGGRLADVEPVLRMPHGGDPGVSRGVVAAGTPRDVVAERPARRRGGALEERFRIRVPWPRCTTAHQFVHSPERHPSPERCRGD